MQDIRDAPLEPPEPRECPSCEDLREQLYDLQEHYDKLEADAQELKDVASMAIFYINCGPQYNALRVAINKFENGAIDEYKGSDNYESGASNI